jgi:hypothetical protein
MRYYEKEIFPSLSAHKSNHTHNSHPTEAERYTMVDISYCESNKIYLISPYMGWREREYVGNAEKLKRSRGKFT